MLVGTHLNTKHIHNDISFCSTSFIDGKRFNNDKKSQHQIRDISDRLCKEYDLSVIKTKSGNRKKNYKEHYAEQNGIPTLRDYIRNDLDYAICNSKNLNEFWGKMFEMKYTFNMNRKHPTVTPNGSTINFRFDGLGEHYSFEEIENRILIRDKNMYNSQKENKSYDKEDKKHTNSYKSSSEQSKNESKSYDKDKKYDKKTYASYTYRKPNKVYHTKGVFKKHYRPRTFRGFYLHYSYLLNAANRAKNRPDNNRIPFSLYKDLQHLNKVNEQMKYIFNNNINTDVDLKNKRASIEDKINKLQKQRTNYRNVMRQTDEEDNISDFKVKIKDITSALNDLYKERKMCDDIKKRTEDLQDNNVKGKEKTEDKEKGKVK